MITLIFDYKIKNVSDIHFNYNMDANITSMWDTFTLNERLKDKRGHKNEKLQRRKRKYICIYIFLTFHFWL